MLDVCIFLPHGEYDKDHHNNYSDGQVAMAAVVHVAPVARIMISSVGMNFYTLPALFKLEGHHQKRIFIVIKKTLRNTETFFLHVGSPEAS